MKFISIALIVGVAILSLFSFTFLPSLRSPKVQSEKEYSRIVSLAPSMSETIIALQQEHRLIGITIHCPKDRLGEVKSIGSFAEPNFEAILALAPDLVLAVPHIMAKSTLDQLRANGIEIFAHQPDTLSDIKYIISAIAKKLAVENLGSKLILSIDQAIELAKKTVAQNNSNEADKTILMAVSHAPFVVAGKNAFASQIMELLGFNTIADDPTIAWPVWPLEQLLVCPPRMLILADGRKNYQKYLNLFNALGLDLDRAKMRLVVPDRPIFNSPSPVVIEDINYLTHLLAESI